jgi:hypothetical protein
MAVVIPLIALALILGILGVVIWSMVRRPKPGEKPTPQPRNATLEEIEGYALELRDQLDRRPFGETLARDVWQKLMHTEVDEGVIYGRHRDFCGQGLIRTTSGVKLCDVQDAGYNNGPPIAQWFDEEAFVAFFAHQSDYSCSGWDESAPTFFTSDSWYRANQRISRDVLERFVSGKQP